MSLQKWTITFFGSGLSPVAPGTAGSLLASLLFYGAYRLGGWPAFWVWQVILAIGLGAAILLSVGLGPWAIAHYGRKDPQPFVLDEVAGICLTNLLLPVLGGWRQAYVLGLAFLAFRLFDVTKPPPARQLEKFPAGWGILLDDLAAAIYANLLCQILLRVVFQFH